MLEVYRVRCPDEKSPKSLMYPKAGTKRAIMSVLFPATVAYIGLNESKIAIPSASHMQETLLTLSLPGVVQRIVLSESSVRAILQQAHVYEDN
jgi:hypothetical protein